MPSVTEGVYFTAASITTLGYGDILLKPLETSRNADRDYRGADVRLFGGVLVFSHAGGLAELLTTRSKSLSTIALFCISSTHVAHCTLRLPVQAAVTVGLIQQQLVSGTR